MLQGLPDDMCSNRRDCHGAGVPVTQHEELVVQLPPEVHGASQEVPDAAADLTAAHRGAPPQGPPRRPQRQAGTPTTSLYEKLDVHYKALGGVLAGTSCLEPAAHANEVRTGSSFLEAGAHPNSRHHLIPTLGKEREKASSSYRL